MEPDTEPTIKVSAELTRDLGPTAVGLASRMGCGAIADVASSSLRDSLERIPTVTSGIGDVVVGSGLGNLVSRVSSSAISDLTRSSLKGSVERMSSVTSGLMDGVVGSGFASRIGSGALSNLATSSLGDSLERISTITSGIAERVPELWEDSGGFAGVAGFSEAWNSTALRDGLFGLVESARFNLDSLGPADGFVTADFGKIATPSAIVDHPAHVASGQPYTAQLDRIDGVVADLHSARAEERAAHLAVPGLLECLLDIEETQVLIAREAESRQHMRDDEARVRANWNLAVTVFSAMFAAAFFVLGLL